MNRMGLVTVVKKVPEELRNEQIHYVRSARSKDAAFCGYQSASRTTRQALDSQQPSLPGCRSPRLERPAGRNHVVIVTDDLLPTT